MGVDKARDASEKYLVFKTLLQHCSYTPQNLACKLPPIPKRTYQLGNFNSPPANFKQKSVLFLRYPLASSTLQASSALQANDELYTPQASDANSQSYQN